MRRILLPVLGICACATLSLFAEGSSNVDDILEVSTSATYTGEYSPPPPGSGPGPGTTAARVLKMPMKQRLEWLHNHPDDRSTILKEMLPSDRKETEAAYKAAYGKAP